MIYTKDINEAIHYIKTSEKVDVSSRPDRAVFYSGGKEIRFKGENHGENRKKAEDFCAKHPEYTTLEKTPFGQYLENNKVELRKVFGKEGVNKIWAATSERYAREASGKITAFVEEAKHDKIFRTHELKTLINNEKVTYINGVSRDELKNDLKKSYDLQSNLSDSFHKVKDSNVGKDLRIDWDGNKNQEAPNKIQSEEKKNIFEFEYKGKIYVVESSKELESLQFDKDSLAKLENLKNNDELEISYSKDNKSNENAQNSLEVDKAKVQRQEPSQDIQQGR